MTEVLDTAALANLLAMVGDDPAFVDELADAYVADAPIHAAALRDAAARGAPADLVRPAHTLKGASLTFGAHRVAAIARRIEDLGRAGSLIGIEGLLADLAIAIPELHVALAGARARRWGPV